MSYEPIRITFDPPIESKDGKEKITHAVIYDAVGEGNCWCGKPAIGWGVCSDHWEDEE